MHRACFPRKAVPMYFDLCWQEGHFFSWVKSIPLPFPTGCVPTGWEASGWGLAPPALSFLVAVSTAFCYYGVCVKQHGYSFLNSLLWNLFIGTEWVGQCRYFTSPWTPPVTGAAVAGNKVGEVSGPCVAAGLRRRSAFVPALLGPWGRGCSVPEFLQVCDRDLLKGLLMEPLEQSYTALMDQIHLGFREIPTAPFWERRERFFQVESCLLSTSQFNDCLESVILDYH